MKERARRENRTAGQVLSDLARQAISRLARAAQTEYHEFWPCSVSLLDGELFDHSPLHGHRQVTDAYLLALATAHDGRFVTFDQSIPLNAVYGATAGHLAVI